MAAELLQQQLGSNALARAARDVEPIDQGIDFSHDLGLFLAAQALQHDLALHELGRAIWTQQTQHTAPRSEQDQVEWATLMSELQQRGRRALEHLRKLAVQRDDRLELDAEACSER